MRVLQVLKTGGVGRIGGAERHLFDLLPTLTARGLHLRVLVATAPHAEVFTDGMLQRGVSVTTVPAGPDLNPLLYRRIRQEIASFRPDIVHTHLGHADLHGQPAAKRSGVAGVSSVHAAYDLYRRFPYRLPYRSGSRTADRTIAISDHVRRFAEELRLNDAAAIRVVHYGIPVAAWATSHRDRELARALYDVRPDDIVVGVASRLVPDKGHFLLLDAFSQAVRAVPPLLLLIAGDGALRGETEAAAQAVSPERARVLGFVADIRSFFRACDIVVFPSLPALSEGFGLAALEAMATGRPVITTGVGALAEIVIDEESGLHVDPGDPRALASALDRLATNGQLRNAMGAAARARAEEQFSLERMVDRTVDVYRETLGNFTVT
jgi:glycosyltransferase involved in cell wall biosynthesis